MCRPLKQWLYAHRDLPYPNKGEKLDLAAKSKMTITQVWSTLRHCSHSDSASPKSGLRMRATLMVLLNSAVKLQPVSIVINLLLPLPLFDCICMSVWMYVFVSLCDSAYVFLVAWLFVRFFVVCVCLSQSISSCLCFCMFALVVYSLFISLCLSLSVSRSVSVLVLLTLCSCLSVFICLSLFVCLSLPYTSCIALYHIILPGIMWPWDKWRGHTSQFNWIAPGIGFLCSLPFFFSSFILLSFSSYLLLFSSLLLLIHFSHLSFFSFFVILFSQSSCLSFFSFFVILFSQSSCLSFF